MPFCLGNYTTHNMEEYAVVSDISVVDVYDIASEIGKECEKLIDSYGVDSVTNLMPKVIHALELLENLATKNERENTTVQELQAKISQLESDKIEKAEDRQRFEKELEQIEEHWRQESRDLVEMVTRLQEENRRLSEALQESRSDSQYSSKQTFTASQEVDIAVLQHLRSMIDKQRDQIRGRDKELLQKNTEIENLTAQVEKLGVVGRELKRKQRQAQMQARGLVEERADFLAQLQDQNRELINLRARLGLAKKENEDLSKLQGCPDLTNKAIYDLDDPDRPRFTTAELKEILHERNELKARVSDLEDELELYRPKPETVEDDKDAPVQGPLPYEPDDAPWKKTSESGIRKFFRKIFSESSSSFLVGSSPRRSLSSLSKMALSGNSTYDESI
ncbi:RILP-like protein homolog isoform X1 [Bombus affinis]|uniref:RILP-like protein homolog isoform X1 n=3 Tax=Bombus TaxID=28641 RepID=A0A6P8MMJ3_9HYME|nr:RILP-like protein homolog isoform X1 [Bombus terrestris]XP_003490939.1 RILP-like protein homolog isoform X1 [Bombus impatiens]XP_012166318.1 RILP-like protein homolog isoform X1 [Bombus terrestris]XP_012166319.1 RILP-like protein homolog isoform X1 [Bombus terrestris]XP_012243111.1 RILP-like protein homolog isoform X1 [Bombus impatiens]XP_033177600.1 RILP-like protein homolog isoform X1 [Bombus impatiens]XP_033197501.1 RILP-like protein homolog isoform X1 [Bombus vancouverensis nearcticus]